MFGSPSTRLEDYTSPSYEYLGVTEDGIVEIRNVDAFTVDFTVPKSAIDAPDDRLYLYSTNADTNSLMYSTFEQDGDVRVIIYSREKIERDELNLRVSGRPYRSADRTVARHSPENANYSERVGILPEEAVKGTTDIQNQIESFELNSTSERFSIERLTEFDQRIDSIVGSIENTTETVVEELSDGVMLTMKYRDSVVDFNQHTESELQCPSCGKPILIKEIAGPLGDVRRMIGTCADGTRKKFDIPVVGDGNTLEFPEVSITPEDDEGNDRLAEITFRNPFDHPMLATFAPSIWRVGSRVDGEAIFDPESKVVTLDSGASETVTFFIRDELLKPNQHYVLGRVIGNLRVYSGLQKFFVGDKGGIFYH